MDRGLREALVAAANRSVLPAEVEADVGRYPPDAEAAVYFCCLEAMQNAGKHAGEGARLKIVVSESEHVLRFDVVDDGAGFVVSDRAGEGPRVREHGRPAGRDRRLARRGERPRRRDARQRVDSARGRGDAPRIAAEPMIVRDARGPRACERAPARNLPCGRTRSRRSRARRREGRPPSTSTGG